MADGEKRRKRVWVPAVDVDADELDVRLDAVVAGGLDEPQQRIAAGIRQHIKRARDAANRKDPIPGRPLNWWRGTLVEAAYRNLHAARTEMIDLYDENELQAEIPVTVARAQSVLHRDDPRRLSTEELMAKPQLLRPRLRRLIDDSYELLDAKHAQLRSFRNILILSAALIAVLVAITIFFVYRDPDVMPFCFPNEVTVTDTEPVVTRTDGENCPTGSAVPGPSSDDILMVTLLGALGGALAASVSIRNLKGTSTAYDVPVALALLKVPLGAFTAILALVAIRGDFVPGLSTLDSQEQILAYALVFGFAQQIFTRLLDQRAQTLLEGLPGGTETEPPPTPAKPTPLEAGKDGPAEQKALGPTPPADLPDQDVEVESSDEPADVEPEDDPDVAAPVVAEDEVAMPDPLTGQGDELQEDEVPPELIPREGEVPPHDAEPPPADLPDQDVEVESSDEPADVEPEDDLDVAAPVVAEDEVAMPDPLTGQGDELQEDEVPPELIPPEGEVPPHDAEPPPADLPDQDVEVESSDEPADVEPEDDPEVAAPVVAEDEVAMPDPLTGQRDELQDDEVPPEDEAPPDVEAPPDEERRG